MTSSDSIDIQENVPLGPLTTLKVGGPARFFARAESEAGIVDAFAFADRNDLDVFVLGGGSNVLISDDGFDGLVIQPALMGITVSEQPDVAGDFNEGFNEPEKYRASLTQQSVAIGGYDLVRLTAGAGEDWDAFVTFCVEKDLAGVECLSGIPGFVGGTPVQNVGAYGQEVSETIVSVRCYDRADRETVELANRECGFTYRTSIFNSTQRDRYVVLSVTYQLTTGGPPKIVYKDLKEHFSDHQPTLKETRDAVLDIRRAKSMVIDPHDPNSRSAGSFFKNPVVANSQFEEIAAAFESGTVPYFPAADDKIKIPAAWLIERSGFSKGYRLGNAGISTKHSLALVNCNGASAAEIVALKEQIQDRVLEKFGILLQPEPVFVGFE